MILKIVEDLIQTYNTSDPFRICDYLDVLVVRVPLVKVNGFYQRFEDQDIIYINQDLNEEESTLVLAHELGHLILHSDVNALYLKSCNQLTSRYEIQANAFAILLLRDRLNLENEIPLLDWRYDNYNLINLIRHF